MSLEKCSGTHFWTFVNVDIICNLNVFANVYFYTLNVQPVLVHLIDSVEWIYNK